MNKIFKYKLDFINPLATDVGFVYSKISVPFCHEILKADFQNSEIHVWIVFDVKHENTLKEITFLLAATGWEFDNHKNLKHIDTIFNGKNVWHIFKQG